MQLTFENIYEMDLQKGEFLKLQIKNCLFETIVRVQVDAAPA